MNPREFKTLAERLLTDNAPSHNRTAIGRAYYAAFHVALEYLRSAGFAIRRNHTAHEEVSRHLGWSEDLLLTRAASQLGDMRGMRNKADYDLDKQETEGSNTASLWVGTANRCITSLDSAFGGSNKAGIVVTITENRKKAYGS